MLPLCHCPAGVERPAWCPPDSPFSQTAAAGGGFCWNGPYREGHWAKHAAGWSVLLNGHQPQHLVRSRPHPRIVQAVPVVGATPEQLWLVPVLIRPVLVTDTAKLYEPAIDRVWRNGAWETPTDLDRIIAALLDRESDAPTPPDQIEAQNAALVRLAIDVLALTHHVDEALLSLTEWMTESVLLRVTKAAAGIYEGAKC